MLLSKQADILSENIQINLQVNKWLIRSEAVASQYVTSFPYSNVVVVFFFLFISIHSLPGSSHSEMKSHIQTIILYVLGCILHRRALTMTYCSMSQGLCKQTNMFPSGQQEAIERYSAHASRCSNSSFVHVKKKMYHGQHHVPLYNIYGVANCICCV